MRDEALSARDARRRLVQEIDELSRELSLEGELVLADGPAVAAVIKQHYGEPAAPPTPMNAPVSSLAVPMISGFRMTM